MNSQTAKAFGLVALFGTNISAGECYKTICHAPKCGFTLAWSLGGGEEFGKIDGVCLKCKTVKSITWGRNERKPVPAKVISNSETKKFTRFFHCPDCSSLFPAFEQLSDFSHCPKCGQSTLNHKPNGTFD